MKEPRRKLVHTKITQTPRGGLVFKSYVLVCETPEQRAEIEQTTVRGMNMLLDLVEPSASKQKKKAA